MIIDLTHNQIVSETLTDAFSDAIRSSLIPKLCMKYGERLVGIQMYEDYIADRFFYSGEWYYPLTVMLSDAAPLTQWIAYPYPMENAYKDLVPYAYIGDEPLEFRLCDSVPREFEEKLLCRGRYSADGAIPLSVSAVKGEITMLCGKYSQSFLDEMARQITIEIEREHHVTGLADSGIRLELVFAPGTYMEHTSEGVTYRRLLMNDGGRAMKDFWVRWERTDGDGSLTVSDTVAPGAVSFRIGEDVPQKIREREYRFLARANVEKYRNSMGRKNVTEWRELLKKAIKRGTLSRVIAPLCDVQEYMREEKSATYTKTVNKKIPEPTVEPTPTRVLTEEDELRERLAQIVERSGNTAPVSGELPPIESSEEFEAALMRARSLLGFSAKEEAVDVPVLETVPAPVPETVPAIGKPARESATSAPEKNNESVDAEALRLQIRMQVEREFEARERERLEQEARRAVAEKGQREAELEKLRREREQTEQTRRELEELRAETLRLQEEIRRRTEDMKAAADEPEQDEPFEECTAEELYEVVEETETPVEQGSPVEQDAPAEDAQAIEETVQETEEPVEVQAHNDDGTPAVSPHHPTHTDLEERLAAERLYTAEAVREEARRIFAQEMARLEEERKQEEERVRREEEDRLAAIAREEEIRRQIEIQQKLEAERRRAEAEERQRAEAIRMEEERRRLEEIRREEENRRAEAARLAEEHRRMEEMARLEDERRRAEIERLEQERQRAEQIAREAYAKHLAEAERLETERRRAEALVEEQNRRIEEAARLAEEQRRLAEKTRLEQQRVNAEAARAEQEQRMRLEAVRREEERRREEALRMQEESRLAEQTRLAEEERIRQEAQRRLEDDRLREEAAQLAETRAKNLRQGEDLRREEAPKVKYTYVSRTVHLMFRRAVDPNIVRRIQQLMNDTISYFNKQDVYISVRAEIVNNMQIDLVFQKIPQEERPLLINIIEVLGRSDLGIAKATLE